MTSKQKTKAKEWRKRKAGSRRGGYAQDRKRSKETKKKKKQHALKSKRKDRE